MIYDKGILLFDQESSDSIVDSVSSSPDSLESETVVEVSTSLAPDESLEGSVDDGSLVAPSDPSIVVPTVEESTFVESSIEESFTQVDSPSVAPILTGDTTIVVDGPITILQESQTEEAIVAHVDSLALDSSGLPYSACTVSFAGGEATFPSSRSEDLYIVGRYLYNTGDPVTVGIDLQSSSSTSNYVISEVTFPTYNSSAFYQYNVQYGAPYRIVDRYVDNYGRYSSLTRDSSTILDFTDAHIAAFRGFGGFDISIFIILLIVLFLTILGRFRRV